MQFHQFLGINCGFVVYSLRFRWKSLRSTPKKVSTGLHYFLVSFVICVCMRILVHMWWPLIPVDMLVRLLKMNSFCCNLYLSVSLNFQKTQSFCHCLVQVYTWGKGYCGALGHGDEIDKTTPELLNILKNNVVVQVCTLFCAIIIGIIILHANPKLLSCPPCLIRV